MFNWRKRGKTGIASIAGASQLLFDTLKVGVLAINPDLDIVDFNPALLNMLNLTEEQLEQHNLRNIEMPYLDRIIKFCKEEAAQKQTSYHDLDENLFKIVTIPVMEKDQLQGYLICFHDISDQKVQQQENRFLATTDPLTGALNRQQFISLAEHNFALAVRSQQPVSILIIDIDHFKKINDMYGYTCGDELLKQVSDLCQYSTREIDIFGRYGNQDFVAFLPETSQEDAILPAERMRKGVKDTHFNIAGYTLRTSISIGLASLQPDLNHNLDDLLREAEHALYRAKENGHNRVQIWSNGN